MNEQITLAADFTPCTNCGNPDLPHRRCTMSAGKWCENNLVKEGRRREKEEKAYYSSWGALAFQHDPAVQEYSV